MRGAAAGLLVAALAGAAGAAPLLAPIAPGPAGTWQLGLEFGLAERDLEHRFERSDPFLLKSSSRRALGAADYRVTRNLALGLRLGAADIEAGEVEVSGVRRNLGGSLDFAIGVRGEWEHEGGALGLGHAVGIILDYLDWSSPFGGEGGRARSEEFGVALRYAAPFPIRPAPEGRIYGGVRWSAERHRISIPGATGRAEERDATGIFLGYGWPVSDQLVAHLEGRFIDKTGIYLSLSAPRRPAQAPDVAPARRPPITVRRPPPPPPEERPAATRPALPEVRIEPVPAPPAPPPPPPVPTGSVAEAERHLAEGNRYASLGRYPEAAEAFRRALALRPDDFRTHYNLGTVLYAARDWRGALEAYREAVRLRPDSTNAWNFRGLAAYRLGDLAEAETAWRRALEIDPRNDVARRNLEAIGRAER